MIWQQLIKKNSLNVGEFTVNIDCIDINSDILYIRLEKNKDNNIKSVTMSNFHPAPNASEQTCQI